MLVASRAIRRNKGPFPNSNFRWEIVKLPRFNPASTAPTILRIATIFGCCRQFFSVIASDSWPRACVATLSGTGTDFGKADGEGRFAPQNATSSRAVNLYIIQTSFKWRELAKENKNVDKR